MGGNLLVLPRCLCPILHINVGGICNCISFSVVMGEESNSMRVITKRVAILYIIVFMLVLLDVVTTTELLRLGGTELSPIAVLQWQTLGFDMTVKLKIGMVLFLGFMMVLVNYASKTDSDVITAKRVLTVTLLGLTVFFVFVVANNTYWIFYARSLS